MTADRLPEWLDALGYTADRQALHGAGAAVASEHPYAPELRMLLDPQGAIRARAVYDVEGVPTVVFVAADSQRALTADELEMIRQRLWNQNLASIVLSIDGAVATALPVRRKRGVVLQLRDANVAGEFSASDIRSSDIQARHPDWFNAAARVDKELLKNIGETVGALKGSGLSLPLAQTLMGQVLFISYLEHRSIVSDAYRSAHRVSQLHELVAAADAAGVIRLIQRLRKDFNGDFLAESAKPEDAWLAMGAAEFRLLDLFLNRVDMETGQGSLWNYDFSFIPVELLSGLYESFLGDEQEALGAYYTPRHLAILAIDEALAPSLDPLSETIFDGACGSGILLTTAFRRLLAIKEAREKRQLSLVDRIELLRSRIFGSDINDQACRVTAFSLYLSLLEGLQPTDIRLLQQHEEVKLPPLREKNLIPGVDGDFFGQKHPFLRRRFSLILSNPPWKEPKKADATTADAWAEIAQVPSVRRQIAGLFALRALDFLQEGGRLCLILPVSQFLAPTSARFVEAWLNRVQPLSLVNFGDLQQLLFETASHSCVVAVGRKRKEVGLVPTTEEFDYCIPKADVSLLFGRLTLLSADRHRVQTQAVIDDPQRLVTLMWGDQRDITLWRRLTALGTFDDFYGRGKRWRTSKGVHFEDSSVDTPVSAEPLRALPYIEIGPLKLGIPVLPKDALSKFPEGVATVAAIGDRMALFDGPRILFPDGFSREEREVRATFFDGPGSFSSSIGVIAGPKADEDLLRFAAVYLRSSLAQYFLAIRAYQVLCERNRASLKDIRSFPFFAPERSRNPEAAARILREVANATRELEVLPALLQPSHYEHQQKSLNRLVYEYFGLSASEQGLVDETVEVLLPSVRPRSYTSLRTPAQARADKSHLDRYAKSLLSSLMEWRHRLGGSGSFAVEVCTVPATAAGPIGAVRVVYDMAAGKDRSRVISEQAAVAALLGAMRSASLSPLPRGDLLQASLDTFVWTDSALFIARPLVRRSWLERSALRDAQRIVEMVPNMEKAA